MLHALKTEPFYFESIMDGSKLFEVRKLDRLFMSGDQLVLQEWNPNDKQYTGREWHGQITYVLADERFCKKGYCILGIKPKDQ